MWRAAKRRGDKHLPEGKITMADVQKAKGAHHRVLGRGDPEVSASVQVVSLDIPEIWLLLCGDRDPKLLALNGEDEWEHLVLVGRGEGTNSGWHARNLAKARGNRGATS